MVTSAYIYSVRFGPSLVLPDGIQRSIARLRTVPATYRPFRPARPKYGQRRKEATSVNWRTEAIKEYVRRVRETTDPQYDEMFGIFNKIAGQNMEKLSRDAITILQSRDEQFRLRVTTLLFNKAIKGSAYAGVMADLATRLNAVVPDISEDLELHAQMFGTLYDMSETLTFPASADVDFDKKVIEWSTQKDTRRGYARFLTHLFIRDIISGQALQESMQKVIQDLKDTVVLAKSEQSEENATQFADFLFEIAKLLKPTAVELRGLILISIDTLLKKPRSDFPSLNIRSRFKLEDTVKCVKVC